MVIAKLFQYLTEKSGTFCNFFSDVSPEFKKIQLCKSYTWIPNNVMYSIGSLFLECCVMNAYVSYIVHIISTVSLIDKYLLHRGSHLTLVFPSETCQTETVMSKIVLSSTPGGFLTGEGACRTWQGATCDLHHSYCPLQPSVAIATPPCHRPLLGERNITSFWVIKS